MPTTNLPIPEQRAAMMINHIFRMALLLEQFAKNKENAK